MKDFFKNIKTLLIVVLVMIILFMRVCSGGGKDNTIIEPITITKIETKWDTLNIYNSVYIPQWRTKTETIYDTIPLSVDTLEILKDYFSKYSYTDTLDLDSLGDIVINDTISKNSILSREIKSNVFIPTNTITTTITNTVHINNRELYWGLGLQGRTNQLNYLGGELLYKTKTKQIYGFGLGVDQNFQPVISGRMYWKLGK